MPIRAILFDMFDTLMLIEKNHEFYNPALMRMYRYLNKNGIDIEFEKFNAEYIKNRDRIYAEADLNFEEPHFNVRVLETLKSLGYSHEASSPIVAEATNEFCEEFMTYVRIDKNTDKMLRSVHGKYKLGVVSNFAIPECVIRLLEANEIDRMFDVIMVSAAVNKRKPSPEIFKITLKALGVSASETVFVGDTIDADIEGPKAVGMKAIYIERRMQEIKEIVPDQTIKSLAELPWALEQCEKLG